MTACAGSGSGGGILDCAMQGAGTGAPAAVAVGFCEKSSQSLQLYPRYHDHLNVRTDAQRGTSPQAVSPPTHASRPAPAPSPGPGNPAGAGQVVF